MSAAAALVVCVSVRVQGDEWEEKWGEHYHVSGKVAKYADKWGKAGEGVGVLLVTSYKYNPSSPATVP